MDEVKKKGRPKKVVEDSAEVEAIKDKLARLDAMDKQVQESIPGAVDEPKVQEQVIGPDEKETALKPIYRPKIALADNMPYPEDQDSDLEEIVKDVRLPESNEDRRFWGKVFKKNKIKKDGTVAVMLLHPTTDATVHYVVTESDGSFKIGEEQYHVNEHCLYSLKIKRERYPLCILPTWTMIPIGTKAWFELSQERRGHELERIILNAIKKEEAIKAEEGVKKKGMNAKTIWILIAVVVGGYIFLKSRGSLG